MVRDLDKLRTRSEFRLRSGHLALIVLTTAVAVGLLFVVGNAMAGTGRDDRSAAAARDPLAALERPAAPAAEARPVSVRKPPAPSAVPNPEPLPPLALTFHERLGRSAPTTTPSTLFPAAAPAAVEAEDPEDAPLPIEDPTTHPPAPPLPGSPFPTAPAIPATTTPGPLAAAAPSAPPALPPGVPVAPPPVQSAREPLAAPLPPGDPQPLFEEPPSPPIAQAGERGVFTLQVASFAAQEEAIAYMNMLRQRGHESFIVRADCGERGLVYRVRVGPFASQAEAERYRRRFERTERIPTFVVRRILPPPEPLPHTL